MGYRVIAAGPVVGGNGNDPYRIVLLGWNNKDEGEHCDCGSFDEYSTHCQAFRGGDWHRRRTTDLFWGHYYRGSDGLKLAYRDFGERLTKDAENYGHHAIPNFKADMHAGSTTSASK